MSGKPEPPEPKAGDPGRRGNLVLAAGCLIPLLATLIGVASLLIHYAIKSPVSPYQIEFSTSGKACSTNDSRDSALILDQDTGEALYCSIVAPVGSDDGPQPRGVFSAEEVGRITQQSRALASDKDFSDADRRAVEQLVAQISREHGHHKMAPTLSEHLTWNIGLYSLIGGLATLIGLGLWGHYRDTQNGPPAP